jgi:hypothetical protein
MNTAPDQVTVVIDTSLQEHFNECISHQSFVYTVNIGEGASFGE